MIDNNGNTELVDALYNKDEKKAIAILNRLSEDIEKSALNSLLISNSLDETARILSTEDQEIFAQFQRAFKQNQLQNIGEIGVFASNRVVLESIREELKRQNRLAGDVFINTGYPILDAVLRAGSRKLTEDITTAGFESLLGLFIHGGLTIIFPPLMPLYLPWNRLITWFAKVGIDARRDLRQDTTANTVYKVYSQKPGVLNVQNLAPQTLTGFPVSLPERYEILVEELFKSNPNLDFSFSV